MSELTLDADNTYVTLTGPRATSKAILSKIDDATSYKVAGYHFSPAWREKRWDGKEHLLTLSKKAGTYRFHMGVMADVKAVLAELEVDFDVVETRRRKPAEVEFLWNPDVTLRPYQQLAVDAVVKAGGGLVKMPIRAGKTKTAAGIIHALKARTLFLVTSQLLLHQTKAALASTLQAPIGMIGDGEWDVQDITVATIQSLVKRHGSKAYRDVTKRFDLLIFDEAHHLKGTAWSKAMLDFDAFYKVGLSATIYLESRAENEKGIIWLKACCGDITVNITASELIEDEHAYLMRPTVTLVPIRLPAGLEDAPWGAELRDAAIVRNPHRNEVIAQVALELVEGKGLKVLVIANRLAHIQLLLEALRARGLSVRSVVGADPHEDRMASIKAFVDGRVSVLVGTVFGEGVDIPQIEAVINAEGGQDMKATMQRMRCLTPAPGKTECVFVDLMDFTNRYFAQHSRERMRAYRTESAFRFKIRDPSTFF